MVEALAEHQIDLVVALSPWPETFSYVAYEAFAAGADVVTLACSGNIADAVRAHERGVVLRDAAALLRFFTEFAAVHYVIDQRRAGRRTGAMRLVGTTASYDPAVADPADRLEVADPLFALFAGDAPLAAAIDGEHYRFELPEAAGRLRLLSRSMLPTPTERRRLGVGIAAMSLDGEPVYADA